MNRTRVLTALLLAPVAILAVLLLPSPWLLAVAALLFLAGTWEWARMSGVRGRLTRGLLLASHAAAMAALAWWGHAPTAAPLQLVALVGVIWWQVALWWMWRFDFASRDSGRNRALKLMAGALSIIPAWAALALLHMDGELGPRWALLGFALIWAADSGAYVAGTRWGRTKLAPRISPGKTREGALGGIAASMLIGLVAFPFLGLGWAQLPLLMLAVGVACAYSIAGDLFESLIKRHSGCKDSGAVFPGHGGVMDRIDSVLAGLPVFWLLKELFGL